MKYIQKIKKGKAYSELLKVHKSKGSYEDIRDDKSKNFTLRTDILESLLVEQNGICAYCMRSITIKNATIEHIVGQSYVDERGNKIGKDEDTNYNNMLAVCQGDFCLNETHCDKSRSIYQDKNPLLSISPLNHLEMSQVKFTRNGVIYYKQLDEDSKMNDDLNRVLNLNCDGIKESRAKILKAIKQSLIRHKFNKKFAQKELAYWENRDVPYNAYCQVAIFELRKYV